MRVPGKNISGDLIFKSEKDELGGYEKAKKHGDEGALLVFGAL